MSRSESSLAVTVVLGLTVAAPPAGAAVILSFSGDGAAEVTATNPTSSSTVITASDAPVTIASLDGAPLSPVANGFLSLNLSSSSAAQTLTVQGISYIAQQFTGSFSINSALHGAGVNYLSGSFADLVSGAGTGLTLSASDANPGETVSLTSAIVPTAHLGTPLSVNLTFADVNPSARTTGFPSTLAAFSSGLTGEFSANPVTVPEAGSLALLGLGLVGLGALGRRSK